MPRELTLTGRQFIALMLVILFACYFLLWILLGQNIPELSSVDAQRRIKHDIGLRSSVDRLKSWSIPNNSSKHLHVYVQISDLHLSAIWDKARISDLSEFCHQTLNIIKPEVVIATGDLTDAKLENFEGSHQSEWEWQQYKRLVHQTGVLNHSVWLDIRGNHDAFDVPSLTSSENFYRSYSVRGKDGQLSYHYEHKTPDGDVVSFIAMDACLDPGPKRPFNFFGMLSEREIAKIERYAREASNTSGATIFYGHYPTSVISYPSASFARQLIKSGIVYLCGHLHTFANLLPNMYAFQPEGFLELELGDWKDNRLYRVLVLDHGLLSFIDVPTHHYPVVLITNPKNEKFMVDGKEPTENMIKSSHIRILAFSNEPITRVDIYIDGVFVGKASHIEGMLYTLAWQPEKYADGYHYIKAVAVDVEEREGKEEHFFILKEGARSSFSVLQRFVILSDHTNGFKFMFGIVLITSILPLLLCKIFNIHLLMMTESRVGCFMMRFMQKWLRRFCCLGNTPAIFYPILLYDIYILVGPWFIGFVLSENLGVCFAWGIWVKGTVLLTSLTYLYAFLHIITFNIPLTLYLARQIDRNIAKTRISESRESVRPAGWIGRIKNKRHLQRWILRPGKHFSQHFLFFFIIIFQAYLVLSGFLKAYGLLAFILCPIRTWAIFLAIYLHYRVTKPHPTPTATTVHLLSDVTEEDDAKDVFKDEALAMRGVDYENDDDDDDDEDDDGDDEDESVSEMQREKEVHKRYHQEEKSA